MPFQRPLERIVSSNAFTTGTSHGSKACESQNTRFFGESTTRLRAIPAWPGMGRWRHPDLGENDGWKADAPAAARRLGGQGGGLDWTWLPEGDGNENYYTTELLTY